MATRPQGVLSPAASARRRAWWLCGAVATGATAMLVHPGLRRVPAACVLLRDPATLGIFLLAAGAYIAAVALTPRGPLGAGGWALLLLTAGVARAAMFLPPLPSGEDYERYLWDGAVTAAGADPYRYAPAAVAAGAAEGDPRLAALARRGRALLGRVNHPELRTIYPPVAQGLFAAGALLSPLRPAGWRALLAGMELLTVLALAALLRAGRLGGHLAAVWLWNPLVVFETYARLHVDVAVAAFVLTFAWALAARRAATAGVALAAAAGVKLWPVLLVPFLLRAFRADRRRLLVGLVVTAGLLAALAVPYAAALGGPDSGLRAYARTWENAPGAFAVLRAAAERLGGALGLPAAPQAVARAASVGLLAAAACLLALTCRAEAACLAGRMATVGLLVVLLSPAVWPWYVLGALAPGAARPAAERAVATATLPLVYAAGTLLDPAAAAWLVHGPIWAAMLLGAYRRWSEGPVVREGPDA